MHGHVLLYTAFLALGAPLDPTDPSTSLTLHISPAGRDTNPGSADAPLATIAAARDRLRQLRPAHPGPATVILHAGRYELPETFTLAPEDSGEAGAPVTYAAVEGEDAELSAGVLLPPWREANLDGRPVWSTTLPASLDMNADLGTPFRELFLAGQRRVRARTPAEGSFLHIEGFPPSEPAGNWQIGQAAFRYASADAPAWEHVQSGAEVVTFSRWVDSHLRVASIDHATRTVRFTTRAVFELDTGSLYFIEGDRSLLAPGQWWIDAPTRTLSYAPLPGESIATRAVAPRHTLALNLAGDPVAGRFVHDVTFRHILFTNARWWFATPAPSTDGKPPMVGFGQAAEGAGPAVLANGAQRIIFDHCAIAHTEGHGLWLASGCTDCTLTHDRITDLGAGGVKIGEPIIRPEPLAKTARNTLADCTIDDGGRLHHQAVGLLILQSGDNLVTHNRIRSFDYTGISVGWTWGYGPAAAAGNIIEFNDVGELGMRPPNTEPPLGDMGGIYTLGAQADGEPATPPTPTTRRTIIRNNHFHDIAGRTIAWGIYFDEGSAGILAENNVVERTTHGSFHQHYGKDNVLRNNALAFGRDGQLWRTRREDHHSFTLAGNVILYDADNLLQGDWSDHFTLEKNIYWRLGGKPVRFPGAKDLAAWQALGPGHDAGSLVADPGVIFFTSGPPPAVPPGSPLANIGFKPIDLSTVGPRAETPDTNKSQSPAKP